MSGANTQGKRRSQVTNRGTDQVNEEVRNNGSRVSLLKRRTNMEQEKTGMNHEGVHWNRGPVMDFQSTIYTCRRKCMCAHTSVYMQAYTYYCTSVGIYTPLSRRTRVHTHRFECGNMDIGARMYVCVRLSLKGQVPGSPRAAVRG